MSSNSPYAVSLSHKEIYGYLKALQKIQRVFFEGHQKKIKNFPRSHVESEGHLKGQGPDTYFKSN